MAANLVRSGSSPARTRYAQRRRRHPARLRRRWPPTCCRHAGLLAARSTLTAPAHDRADRPKAAERRGSCAARSPTSRCRMRVVQEVREGASRLPAGHPRRSKTASTASPRPTSAAASRCSLPVTEPAALVETVPAAAHSCQMPSLAGISRTGRRDDTGHVDQHDWRDVCRKITFRLPRRLDMRDRPTPARASPRS